MSEAKTMFEKIWDRHAVVTTDEGETLLYVDRLVIHEGSRHVFARIEREGREVRCPKQIFACADHYVPTAPREGGIGAIADPEIRRMVELVGVNTRKHGIELFGFGDPGQGITHVVGPEQGITQPGMVLLGADSHSSTHGAFASLSFGIGWSEVAHIFVTQTLWQRRPKTLRIAIDGALPFGVTAKDVILAIIAKIGAAGALGHAIEYAGSTIRAMSMEARMTVCNMSIEAGGRLGMIAPDETTFAYIEGRPFAPKGAMWERALEYWRRLPSDAGARFDREVTLDAAEVTPMVTWGTSPEHALGITGRVPDPARAPDADKRAAMEAALDYMGLRPGTPLGDIAIDRVFIGSCTNARIEDLRAAAEVARLGRAKVTAWVVPGSSPVKRQAEEEGLDRVFIDAGFEWRDAGCSLCTAINGDMLAPGERCASTTNRNFRGRQGRGGRTHLMSPAMAAAAAITGKLTDVRALAKGN